MLIELIEKWVGKLDIFSLKRASWGFMWRILIGMLPAILGSMIPARIAPLFVLLTLVLLFSAIRPVYNVLYEINQAEIFYCIITPSHLLISVWAVLLARFGRVFQISRIVGAVALVLIVILWPVYSKASKANRSPLCWNYFAVSILVVIQQFIFLVL